MKDFGTYKLLEDKTYIPCSIEEWGKQTQDMRLNNSKHVKQEDYMGYWISTVWLGLDHDFNDGKEPLLFETMIFPQGDIGSEEYCDRYSTWEEAEKGHEKAKQWLIEHLKTLVTQEKSVCPT